jgi:hypothetical protein
MGKGLLSKSGVVNVISVLYSGEFKSRIVK